MSSDMPPQGADLETTWRFLEEGVDHIMTKLQTGVSYSKYMSLYTVSYNYCTSSRMGNSSDSGISGRSESCSIHAFPLTRLRPKPLTATRHHIYLFQMLTRFDGFRYLQLVRT